MNKSDKYFYFYIFVWVSSLALFIGFWSVVLYVSLHFIGKFW